MWLLNKFWINMFIIGLLHHDDAVEVKAHGILGMHNT